MMKSNSLSSSKDPGRNHHSMLAGWVCAAARTKVWTISRVLAAPFSQFGQTYQGPIVTTLRGPLSIEKATSSESFAKQIRMWMATCGLPKKSWGAKLAESLVDTASLRNDLRTRFFDLSDEKKMQTE